MNTILAHRVSRRIEPMVFLLTFRDNGRYILTKAFFASDYQAALTEARDWADNLPLYADEDHYIAFDYDYVGHD